MNAERKKIVITSLLIAAIVILVTGYMMAAQLSRKNDLSDWTHLWLAGRMIATGYSEDLYSPHVQLEVYRQSHPEGKDPAIWRERQRRLGCFYYPPPAALAYSVLAWMPRGTAAVVNAYFNLVLGLVMAWVSVRYVCPQISWLFAVIAIWVFPPFLYNLILGQNAVITALIVVGACALCSRRRDFWAGALLGLLIAKPNWLLAVGWIPLIHGRWRMLSGMAISALAVVGGTAALIGTKPFFDYIEVFRGIARMHEMPIYHLNFQYSGLGLFRKWFGIGQLADALGWVSAALVLVITWKTTWSFWKPDTAGFRYLIPCCLAALLYVNPHLYHYDLMLVSICVIAMGQDWKRSSGFRRWIILLIGAACYGGIELDLQWPWWEYFPIPTLALLALWAWFVFRLVSLRSCEPVPPGKCTLA